MEGWESVANTLEGQTNSQKENTLKKRPQLQTWNKGIALYQEYD